LRFARLRDLDAASRPFPANTASEASRSRGCRPKGAMTSALFWRMDLNSNEVTMNPYFILVRQPKRQPGERRRRLDRTQCARLLQRAGARLFDVYPVSGHFDEMLVCLAKNDDPIQKLVNELRRFEATAMLSNNCGSHWGTVQRCDKTESLTRAVTTKSAYDIVHADDRITLSEMLATMARKRP